MSKSFPSQGSIAAAAGCDAAKLLNALPHPVIAVLPDGSIAEANSAAEAFFGMSRTLLWQQKLANLAAAFSPLVSLVEQVMSQGAAINEYRVGLT
ncbi:MAG: PAS domain-containing protein, partial [Methylocella sp.]